MFNFDTALGEGELCGFSGEKPLQHWLSLLTPYISARLNRALGLTTEGNLIRILFEHKGRIALTSTHLDIYLSLTELPVEVRIAGLDRNPGWVPAAGRFISFHFD